MGAERSFSFPFSEQALLRQIKLAKLWSVVEFLGNNSASLDLDILRELVTKLPAKFCELMKKAGITHNKRNTLFDIIFR